MAPRTLPPDSTPDEARRRRWILALASLVSFLVALDAMVVTTALAAIGRDLGVPIEALEWTVNAYNLSFAVLLLTGAALGDCVLVMRRVPESHGPAAALDLPGALLATGAVLGLVWGLTRAHEAGWASPEVAGALAAGLLLAVAFVVRERLAAAPMVPAALFRARAFSSGIAASFLFYAPMYGTVFFLPQFLQAQGAGPFGAGLRLLPWTATLLVVAPLAGSLVNRVGERPLVVAGTLLQAIGSGWIALIATPDLPYLRLVPPLIVAGIGVSMAMPAAQNAVLGAVAPAEVGKASGTFNTFRYLGGVFGIALMVEVFTRSGSLASPQAFSQGFAQAMAVGAALSLLAALAAWQLPSRLIRPVPAKGLPS